MGGGLVETGVLLAAGGFVGIGVLVASGVFVAAGVLVGGTVLVGRVVGTPNPDVALAITGADVNVGINVIVGACVLLTGSVASSIWVAAVGEAGMLVGTTSSTGATKYKMAPAQ